MNKKTDIVKEISDLVEQACLQDTNHYGYRAWTYHIALVVKNGILLARAVNVDEEIVTLSALLHDYASIADRDLYEEHHIHSALLAENILKQYGYPEDRINRVKHCIMAHRGSKDIRRLTLEAEVVASADAMSHFDAVNSLLYLAFIVHGMDVHDGTEWVLSKLERSWNKLMPAAKALARKKYEAIKIAMT